MDLQVLGDFVLEDNIGCCQIGGLNASGIAEGEGPIAQRAAQWLPDAV